MADNILKKLRKIFKDTTNALKWERGLLEYGKILTGHPEYKKNEDVLCNLGFLYDHAALWKDRKERRTYEDRALKLYKAALKVNPKSARATWGIGRVWWHREDKRAVSYAKKAHRLKRQKGDELGLSSQTIGLVYNSLGNDKKAEKWLLQGMKESPEDFSVYLNLVQFYRGQKNFGKAREYAKILEKLYKKESSKFKKTGWGRIIKNEIIKEAGEPFKKIDNQ